MALTMTAEEVRQQLGAYLTKPLEVTSGTLSTQQSLSVTSIGGGRTSGRGRRRAAARSRDAAPTRQRRLCRRV